MNPENREPNQDQPNEFTYPQHATPQDSPVVEAELMKPPFDPPKQLGNKTNPYPRDLSVSGALAWGFVLLTTALLFTLTAYEQLYHSSSVGGDASRDELTQVIYQGKVLVAQKRGSVFGQPMDVNSTGLSESEKAALDTGPYEQRIGGSILINELESPEAAGEFLKLVDEKASASRLKLTEDQIRLRRIVDGLYGQYDEGNLDSSSLADDDQVFLEEKLGWLGELVLVPQGTPHESRRNALIEDATGMVFKIGVGFIFGILVVALGVVLGITLFVLMLTGKLRSAFPVGLQDHNIYIETFALWMAVFFGSSIVLGLFGIGSPVLGLALQPAIFFGSLIVIGWPVIRGISFSQVREDIGWTFRNPLKESAVAGLTYLATLPFLIPGFIMIFVLMLLVNGSPSSDEFTRQTMPGHPIQHFIQTGGPMVIVLIFLTACVAAPIVEETMFRGVLYRHLRDFSGHWKRWISVLLSAVLNGIIFASIHPQGIYGIPVLATLAVGFSLTREWRSSLVSPMVMHAIHNTAVTCISLFLL